MRHTSGARSLMRDVRRHTAMGSSVGTVQYLCDQAGLGKRLTFKKMFGEYALYIDGKVIALICNDQLFLKPTAEGRALLGEVKEAPPYHGAKDHFLLTDTVDDPEALHAVLLATGRALPEPKPKKVQTKKVHAKKSKRNKA
jgi:TfoX/Sxy family transcriptional regulator of competence genes